MFQLRDARLFSRKVTAVFQHHQSFFALDAIEELSARFEARPAVVPRVRQQNRTVIEVFGLNIRPNGENRLHEIDRHTYAATIGVLGNEPV